MTKELTAALRRALASATKALGRPASAGSAGEIVQDTSREEPGANGPERRRDGRQAAGEPGG
ncbi:MAG: hypothetical protein A2138_26900 [Deltaproteobacteria bacterium RBG_16_71_12]|nr:MAG: hypothetical protein A2138_26900 [Deltaproteobacteria bacterium RBG_16_71_12]